MLDKEQVRTIAQLYAGEVRKVLKPASIILFGSYVNGIPHENSDIDVAVLVDNIEGEDWYNARILLQKIRWREDTFTDIEPHLLDESHDPSGFVQHVIKTGEVVYLSA